MSGIKDIEIHRNYKCDNCKYCFGIKQTASEKWKKKCPKCKKHLLFISDSWDNMSTIVDFGTPKTVGSLAEHNTKKMIKEDKLENKAKAKTNYNILKDPAKYIETGKI